MYWVRSWIIQHPGGLSECRRLPEGKGCVRSDHKQKSNLSNCAPKCEAGKASAILAASSAAACTECVAGKFTGTTGTAECVGCPAGSFSTVVGSASADNCKQVRTGREQSKFLLGDITNKPNHLICSSVRGRQGERNTGGIKCHCLHRVPVRLKEQRGQKRMRLHAR